MPASAPAGRLNTLGAFSLTLDGVQIAEPATKKARTLLVFLVLHQATSISRETLLELLWPESDPERARASLSTALWSLRKAFKAAGLSGDAILHSTNTTITWRAPVLCDATEFRRLAKTGDPQERARAIELYGGDFLQDDFEEWSLAERERLARDYEQLLADSLNSSADVDVAQRLLSRDPYNEEAYTTLIDAQLAANRSFAAVDLIERCRKALAELGAQPSAEFERKYHDVDTLLKSPARDFSLPLMGRNAEFNDLWSRILELRARQGSVTLVHGEPGIGKSTLLRQFIKGIGANMPVHYVQGIDGDARPYGPWGRLFAELTSQDFETYVQRTPQIIESLAGALVQAFDRPSVIVIDDAQYFASEAFETFVHFTIQAASGHAVFVASRPEGLAAIRGALRACPTSEIALAAIESAEFAAGVSHATGGVDKSLAHSVYERSHGHPLFFTEIFKALVRDGLLKRHGNAWTYLGGNEIAIPNSLRSIIEERLRSRGEGAAEIACLFALDPEASLRDLIAIMAMTEDDVIDALDELLASKVILESNTGPHYRFAHDMIAEVAATLLKKPRRERLHRRIADYLQHEAAQNASARSAKHYAACAMHERATQCYLDAARSALEVQAWLQAVAYCDMGLAHCAKLATGAVRFALAGALQCEKAQALSAGLKFQEAIAAASLAIADGEAAHDDALIAAAFTKRAWVHSVLGQDEEGLADATRAQQFAHDRPDIELRAIQLRTSALFGVARYDEAATSARKGISASSALQQWTRTSVFLHHLIVIESARWNFTSAIDYTLTGVKITPRCGISSRGAQQFVAARLALLLDDTESAALMVTDGMKFLDEFRAHPDPIENVEMSSMLQELYLWYLSGMIALREGNFPAAIERAQRANDIASGRAQVVHLLEIEALAARGTSADLHTAASMLKSLPEGYLPNALGFSSTWSTCSALLGAKLGDPETPVFIKRALDEVEAATANRLEDCDLIFTRLAGAAQTLDDRPLANRAKALAHHFSARRREAAGSHYGNARFLSLRVL